MAKAVKRRPPRALPAAKLRPGRLDDVDALLALERQFFTADHQISARGFRHFVASKTSTLLVADIAGKVAGCALVLYRRGSKLARLYSIAIADEFQGRGLARRLLAAAERDALRHGKRIMRLEVRADDVAANTLYRTSGYRAFGKRPRYYGGRIDALRLDKELKERQRLKVPQSA